MPEQGGNNNISQRWRTFLRMSGELVVADGDDYDGGRRNGILE